MFLCTVCAGMSAGGKGTSPLSFLEVFWARGGGACNSEGKGTGCLFLWVLKRSSHRPWFSLSWGEHSSPSQLTGFLHGEQNIHPLSKDSVSLSWPASSPFLTDSGRSYKIHFSIQLLPKWTSDLFMSRVAVFSNDRIPVSSATSYHMDKLAIQRPKSLAKDSFKKTRAS